MLFGLRKIIGSSEFQKYIYPIIVYKGVGAYIRIFKNLGIFKKKKHARVKVQGAYCFLGRKWINLGEKNVFLLKK